MDKSPKAYRKYLPHVAVVIFFVIISLAYFSPAIFDGRELFQSDIAGASGIATDVKQYKAETGERSYWTQSLFGGMPMYQISPSYPSSQPVYEAGNVFLLRAPFNILPGYAWLLFAMCIGFYIFMRSLKIPWLPSAIGALAWCFSSYFLILVAAGHIWKLTALAFIPPTIAGMIWIYQKKWLLGAVVTAFFSALQIQANHIQMTYYFLFVMAALFVGFAIKAFKDKTFKSFALSTLILIGAGLIGVGVNISNLYHTYEYSKHTMRGGSELTIKPDQSPAQEETAAKGEGTKTASGLTKEYITQWSYGIGETWSLMIPNVKGGASGYIGQANPHLDKAAENYRNFVAQMNEYWGNQPFTAGPVYVGAFICFLFILGCFVVKGPIKWALLSMTILSILLSWGHNFMGLTNFFIDYFPLYNKFRTVSSILVIAEFTIPALAVLCLVKWLQEPEEIWKERKYIYITTGLTLGFCLLFLLLPSLFDFMSKIEAENLWQAAKGNILYQGLIEALIDVRIAIFRADVIRTIIFIIVPLIVMLLYMRKKLNMYIACTIVGAIIFVDLWSVDKRYLNDGMFMPKSEVMQRAIPTTQADLEIMKDKNINFRVLNLTVNPYSDATTSAHFKSIGGYHPAKLQRYQDLIDFYISKGNRKVLNMLNMRYVIRPDSLGNPEATYNPDAYTSAWATTNFKLAKNADQELLDLESTDLKTTAIVNQKDAKKLKGFVASTSDSTAHITQTINKPNHLEYSSLSQKPIIGVFSEVFYPEWKATIDGQPAEIFQTDYILRGLVIPAGKHKIVFDFHPQSIKKTEAIGWTAETLLLLCVLVLLGKTILNWIKEKKKDKINE